MGELVRAKASTSAGDKLEILFRVVAREPGDKKLQKLYTDLSDINNPKLLSEEAVIAAETHEAIILTLKNLEEFILAHGQTIPENIDGVCHIHRNPDQDKQGTPYLCWSQFTPKREQMDKIIEIWTMLNVARVLEGGELDFNTVDDFGALAAKHGISVVLEEEK